MKVLADIVAGLWSALCIGATLLWEWGVKRWNKATDTQKSLMLCVAIIVVTLGVVSVANAENAPDSNFGAFNTDNGSTVFMCYTSTNEFKVGIVYTCLVMFPIGPKTLASQGQVSHCTITNYVDDRPYMSCGNYDEVALQSGGI